MQLPSIPSSWTELTWQQLTDVWNILESQADDISRFIAVYEYFTGIKILYAEADITPDGNENALVLEYDGQKTLVNSGDFYLYLFGFQLPENLSKEKGVKVLQHRGILSWLNETYTLYELPQEFVSVGRYKYKLPEPLFTSLTYQQYGNMQKILSQYWQASRAVTGSDNPSDKAVKNALKLRAQFLSHALCGGSMRLVKKDSDAIFLSPKRVYTYTVEQAERNIGKFYTASNSLFLILQQYFSSCLEYYKKEMPELFSRSGEIGQKSPLMAEIDTVNAIMKWKGAYPTQQDVYDANAIFIFGDLKDMAKEAREIETANAKTRSRSK